MKVMIFCDLENFRYSLREYCKKDEYSDVNFKDFHNHLLSLAIKKMDCKIHNPRLIRAYVYTGEYSETQIQQAKTHLKWIPADQKELNERIIMVQSQLAKEKDGYKQEKLKKYILVLKRKVLTNERIEQLKLEINKAATRRKAQIELFNSLDLIDCLELKVKPLKYSRKDLRFIQKGTDVELAVDLVSYAHFNNYDVAIVCSGDLDLLESCKMIKLLGKTVVLVSHRNQVSEKMIKTSDYYIDLAKITEEDVKRLSVSSTDKDFEEPTLSAKQ